MTQQPSEPAPTRKRLTREQRLGQLLGVAWQLVAAEGTDALSLGRLAEAAGITKPTVYDHFGTRQGLLAALYRDFDIRHNRLIDAAIAASPNTLADKARVMASSYIGCVLAEGREIPGVLAALDGSPELAFLKRQCQLEYLNKFRTALTPFAGPKGLTPAGMWGMLGAADALSGAAASAELSLEQACDELQASILSLVARSQA